jgi:hypothetical protein
MISARESGRQLRGSALYKKEENETGKPDKTQK